MPRKQIVVLAILVEAVLAIAAVLGAWIFDLSMASWLVWSAAGFLWGLGGIGVLVALLGLCRRFPIGPVARLMSLVDTQVKPLFRECRTIDLLLISLLAGIGEELFFRGFLQGILENWLGGVLGAHTGLWLSFFIVSGLFGIAHYLSREYALFAMVLGMLLGGLALVTGGLFAPILAHAGYDFVALLLLTRGHSAQD